MHVLRNGREGLVSPAKAMRLMLLVGAAVIVSLGVCVGSAWGASGGGVSEVVTWTLTNHTRDDVENELVHIGASLSSPYAADGLVVMADGKETPYQVEVLEGTRERVERGRVWVLPTVAARERVTYTVQRGQPLDARPLVRVIEDVNSSVIDNGLISVRVPTSTTGGNPAPILGVRVRDGEWIGESRWVTLRRCTGLEVTWLGRGPLFAKVQLDYTFMRPPDAEEDPTARVTITMLPGRPFVEVEEQFDMEPEVRWTFDLARGLEADHALVRTWYDERGEVVDEKLDKRSLEADAARDSVLLTLRPRWSRSPAVGWFFGVSDGRQVIGAAASRAGLWSAPYENAITVRGSTFGGAASLELPASRGGRHWLLFATTKASLLEYAIDPRRRGRFEIIDHLHRHMSQTQVEPLEKLTHGYELGYPGFGPGGFRGQWFYGAADGNPADVTKEVGESLLMRVHEGSIARGDRTILSNMQVRFDRDFFPCWGDGWSPIDARYGTYVMRVPVLQAVSLRDHPKFNAIRRMAEHAVRADLYHSVTMPGGAGQACPGDQVEQMQTWGKLAPIAAEHLGFDMTSIPRYDAAGSFIWRTSVPEPEGKGRRICPMGYTEPPGLFTPTKTNPEDLYVFIKPFYPEGREQLETRRRRRNQIVDNPKAWTTESFAGFGVVFRNRMVSLEETYLAFKAGPNRSGYHGDQLSFHYAAYLKRKAIDHMTGRSLPTPQEHFHNRLSFSVPGMQYADMGGYERLIAFKTTPTVDVAIGEVQSGRLTAVPARPGEEIASRITERRLDVPLVYRRTIVFMKGGDGKKIRDYFVIRDQFSGPAVRASYNLHVQSERVQPRPGQFDFGHLQVLVPRPEVYRTERFDFTNPRGPHGEEKTLGIQLSIDGTSGEFISVLYPDDSGKAPRVSVTPQGAVRMVFPNGRVDTVVFQDEDPTIDDPRRQPPAVAVSINGRYSKLLSYAEVDAERSQGELGLMIPENDPRLGAIPDWLRMQREGWPEGVVKNPLSIMQEAPQ